MHQKLVPDPFFILVNNPKQPLHAIHSFKTRYLKDNYQKPFKNLTFFFLSNQVPFNGQSYQKKGLELVTSRSSGYETSSQKFLYLLYII